MTLDDLGPLLEGGSRVGVVFVTVILSIRLLNATFANSQSSWKSAAATLTESAQYARSETIALRERVEHLETEAGTYHADRAEWLIEQATMTNRIAHLEAIVADLTARLQEGNSHDR